MRKYIIQYYFLITVILLLGYVFSIFYRNDDSFDQDLGRHLKLGEIIMATGKVPSINLFSYTNTDFAFINSHSLFEIFVYLANQVAGIQFLLILKIFLILTSILLILLSIGKKNYPFLLPIAFIFLHVLRERVDLRPEIFSFFFTALTLFILTKFDSQKNRWIFLLPLVQLIWVNTHIYFLVGLLIQIIFTIHFLIIKNKPKFKLTGMVLITSSLVSLVNPNGLAGVLYPFSVFQNYGYSIAENQNMFLLENIGFQDPNFLFVKISVILIIISLFLSMLRNTFTVKNFLLCLLTILLVLSNIRSFPYLVFIALVPTLENLGLTVINKKAAAMFVFFGLLLMFESYYYLSGQYYQLTDSRKFPQLVAKQNVRGAMDFVLDHQLPNPIYNNFDIGSYIIYRGYPNCRVFVDGRPEAYPANFFKDFYIPSQENPSVFASLDKKYNFQTIIFSITDQTPWAKSFLDSIVKNPDWSTVYLDHFMIVLIKRNLLPEYKLQPVVLNQLDPNKYGYSEHISYAQISYFLINASSTDSAKLFAKKAWEISPDSGISRSLYLFTLEKTKDLSDKQLILKLNEPVNSNIWW